MNRQENLDFQKNSRIGITFALPLDRRQSLKFSFSSGARTTIGADFEAFSLTYQYLWFASPKAVEERRLERDLTRSARW